MSESKHTPGPWKYSAYHRSIMGGELSRDGCRIHVASLPGHEFKHPSVDANARLIAAAPELLAAAEEVIRSRLSIGAIQEQGEQGKRHIRHLNELRAAIAKAKGETT